MWTKRSYTVSLFVNDLGADSLDVVELVMAFEDEFNMEIPDDVAENITTVQDAINYAVQYGGNNFGVQNYLKIRSCCK